MRKLVFKCTNITLYSPYFLSEQLSQCVVTIQQVVMNNAIYTF